MKYQISTVTEPGDCMKAVSTNADISWYSLKLAQWEEGQAVK